MDDNKSQRGLLFLEGMESEDNDLARGEAPPAEIEPAVEGEVSVVREPIEVSDFELADIIEEKLSGLMRVSGKHWYIATDYG